MAYIRLTKIFTFEMAHALDNYDGLCKNIHGHSYRLEVTIVGKPNNDNHSPKTGMLIDFSDLKQVVEQNIIQKYDHALVLNALTDKNVIHSLKSCYEKIIIVNYQPTSERLLEDFVENLRSKLPKTIKLHSLTLAETATSYAQWFASDNE